MLNPLKYIAIQFNLNYWWYLSLHNNEQKLTPTEKIVPLHVILGDKKQQNPIAHINKP